MGSITYFIDLINLCLLIPAEVQSTTFVKKDNSGESHLKKTQNVKKADFQNLYIKSQLFHIYFIIGFT